MDRTPPSGFGLVREQRLPEELLALLHGGVSFSSMEYPIFIDVK
jgi:hypothetical protein